MIEIKVIDKASGLQTHGGLVHSQEEATQFIEKFSFSWGEPESFNVVIEDITAQIAQEKINEEALAFLAATDWMCLRALENPSKPVPEEIKAQRQAARDRIKK